MGEAARKIAHSHAAVPARPVLRVVGRDGKRTRTRTDARHAELLRVMALCLVLLVSAGMFRVSLTAKAAEATIDAWQLRKEVKAERLVSRSLEADRSALASPSRIEAVASQTLNMSRPTQVSYLELPSNAGDVSAERGEDGGSRVWDVLMDLAASEAQVMLVGDVGLGSLR